MKKRFRNIHVLLFAIYPPLALFAHNIKDAAFRDLVFWVLTILTTFFILWLIEYFVVFRRHADKSAIALSTSLILFFSFGHIYGFLKPLWWSLFGVTSHTKLGLLLLIIWGVVGLGSHIILFRLKKNLKDVSGTFNVISGSLIVLALITVLFSVRKGFSNHSYDNLLDRTYQQASLDSVKAKSGLPDIYFIILDRYSNNEELQTLYGFDNSTFTDFLESKGFFIPKYSASNYVTTPLSLASSLNLQYLNTEAVHQFDPDNMRGLKAFIHESLAHRFLRSQGYKLVNSGSWANVSRVNPYADYNILNNDMSEFSIIFLSTTIVHPFLSFFDLKWHPARAQWLRAQNHFKNMEKAIDIPGPKFVFAHFLIPHDPFVYDDDGGYVSMKKRLSTPINVGYIRAVKYANRRTEELVENILSRSKIPPVIIIQADEGPNNTTNFDVTDSTDIAKAERMILSSYLLPGMDAQTVLSDSTSPVNNFRIVFNEYFGTHYEMLKDTTFVFPEARVFTDANGF
ncbi:MAG: hypothetical protein V2A56_03065 [bacterium]